MGNEKAPPERVWITWDDAYPWEFKMADGTEYVRADLVATARKEEREAAFREAMAIIAGQPTAHYIYSGAYPMATDTFRDNAIKAIEATIAIERARTENRKGEG